MPNKDRVREGGHARAQGDRARERLTAATACRLFLTMSIGYKATFERARESERQCARARVCVCVCVSVSVSVARER